MDNHKKELGAVSLFIVVFATLLITVVTVSFIRIMIRDQQQATTADLSQSAYDSAQAGVEDAKRAILRYQSVCATGGDIAACAKAGDNLNSNDCNVGLTGIIDTNSDGNNISNEVKVQESSGANALDQAYTCVKIKLATDDYLGVLPANSSKVIPLVGKTAFDTVRLEWFSSDNLQTTDNFKIDFSLLSSGTPPLLSQTSWPQNRPSIMRTQLMQFGGGFTLGDFEDTNAGQSNANTLFLYPTGITNVASTVVNKGLFGIDARKTATGSPQLVSCSGNLSGGGYACREDITLPDPIGAGTRTAFLRLSALYNATNYRLSLLSDNGSMPVSFDGVQPQIDSTGRANDLFRRVQSRVEVVDVNFPYPDAAVDITGNFCKDFLITNKASDYKNTCTP